MIGTTNMNKIHFASVFGVLYDMDLAYWWTRYYLDMELDSYTVFLHAENLSDVTDLHQRIFKDSGFNVKVCDGPYCDGMVRKLCLEHLAHTLPPEDFLVTADADEFQAGPHNEPLQYRKLEQNYDVISGFLIDRYSSSLDKCAGNPFEQYFDEEDFTGQAIRDFSPPYLRETVWPLTRRTKILAARCGSNVAYIGSHCMKEISSNTRIAENYKVLHFCWRESARRKMAIKSYYSKQNISESFNGHIPEDIEKATDGNRLMMTNVV